jgi:hypothetical protein
VSKVRVRFQGQMTAFHASKAGGVVICISAEALDGLDLDELQRVQMNGVVSVDFEADAIDAPQEIES